MDQSKVNPFVGNTETSAGGSPVSAPSNPAANQAPVKPATPSVPVNPYAPAGAPYAPGSNTPAPDYATSYMSSSDGPAVPNTGASAYTNFSPAPSQNQDIYMPSDSPEKPKLFTKKFIIFAVIGLVLIVGAVVAGVVIQNNKKPSGNKTVDYKAAAKPYFNDYIEYLVFGNESSTGDIGKALASDSPIYAEKMVGEEKSSKKSNYLTELNEKYTAFYDKYSLSKDFTYDLNSLKLYFYDFANISKPSLTEIQDWYSSVGRDGAKQKIDQEISSSSENQQIKDYISLARQESYVYLDFAEKISYAGCTMENFANCYNGMLDMSQVDEMIASEQNISNTLGDNAFIVIRGLYDYYGGAK